MRVEWNLALQKETENIIKNQLEMKNTKTEMKNNTLEGIDSRLVNAEEQMESSQKTKNRSTAVPINYTSQYLKKIKTAL